MSSPKLQIIGGLKRSDLANAIKGTSSGSVVSLPDISPLEHTLNVKARSKNLITPSILGVWLCEVNIADDDLITLTSNTTNGVAYAKVGRVTLEKGKTYICRPINATNVGNVLVWLPNTTTTIWNATTQSYTPTEDVTADVAVYMKTLGEGATSSFYIQLEEGTTPPTIYTPYVEDLSTVNLKAFGGNLIPYPFTKSTSTINGVTFTDNGDGTITANGTATANAIFSFSGSSSNPITLQKATYMFSGSPIGSAYESYYLAMAYNNGGSALEKASYEDGLAVELDKIRSIYIVVKSGVTVNNLVFKPQLELGDKATDYEPYKEPTTYPINANGTVEGVRAIYPITTLIPTEPIVVDATYNVDTKKYIDKKFAELAAMIVNS